MTVSELLGKKYPFSSVDRFQSFTVKEAQMAQVCMKISSNKMTTRLQAIEKKVNKFYKFKVVFKQPEYLVLEKEWLRSIMIMIA